MYSVRHLTAAGAAATLALLCTSLVDPVSPDAVGRVTAAADMRVARASHTGTLLPDGRVLVAGGFAGSGGESRPYASTELYDPATGAFTAGPSMTTGRSGHTATLLPNGGVLLAGGWSGPGNGSATAERYDPATQRLAAAGSLTEPRAGQTATLLPDGRVLLVGGVDPAERPLASAELYDPATGRFVRTGGMALARIGHTATLLASGQVLVVGGAAGHYPSQTVHSAAELYDPATGRFTSAGALGTARYKHAAVALADGSVLVVGGSDARDWRGRLASAERWDPASRTFRPAGRMAAERFKLPDAVALLPDGRVLVAGGAERAEVYAPNSATFAPAAGTVGAARFFSAVTLLRDGRALITGGYADERGGLPASARAYLYAR